MEKGELFVLYQHGNPLFACISNIQSRLLTRDEKTVSVIWNEVGGIVLGIVSLPFLQETRKLYKKEKQIAFFSPYSRIIVDEGSMLGNIKHTGHEV